MNATILWASGIIVLILLLIVLLLSLRNKKSSRSRSKVSVQTKSSNEIDPEPILDRIFKLAPSELKGAKLKYIGKRVEIRTIMNSQSSSRRGNTFREVLLDYQDNRSIHISGVIDMDDCTDQSWITPGGKLMVSGVIRDLQPKEISLDDMKIV